MPKQPKQVIQYSSDESDGSSDIENNTKYTSDSRSDIGSDSDSDNSNDSYDAASEENEDADNKIASIRQQLADVPFDQLIRIQQQMGAHKFNGSGVSRAKGRATASQNNHPSASESESDSDDSGPEMITSNPGSAGNRPASRDSKKMPMVASSKRPVGRFRQVVDLPQKKARDPRFDSMSGNFNEDLFEKSYAFLEQQQRDEVSLMKEEAKKLKDRDPNASQRLQKAASSLESKLAAKKQKQRMQELKRTHRKKELEAVKEGKTPYFLKKRDLKVLDVAQKFSKLKGSTDIDRYLQKRRKHNAAKDHRHMPYKRRED